MRATFLLIPQCIESSFAVLFTWVLLGLTSFMLLTLWAHDSPQHLHLAAIKWIIQYLLADIRRWYLFSYWDQPQSHCVHYIVILLGRDVLTLVILWMDGVSILIMPWFHENVRRKTEFLMHIRMGHLIAWAWAIVSSILFSSFVAHLWRAF